MTEPRSDLPEPELSLSDVIESGIRRATTAIVIASGIIGLAIYARPATGISPAFNASSRSSSSTTVVAAITAGSFERTADAPIGHTSSATLARAMPASVSCRVNRARLVFEPMTPT